MSALLAPANPHSIKATHRRRGKVASGRFVQRYYDAEIGRFISPDPVGPEEDFIKHFNRYNYALNNPVRYTDPDGRRCATTNGKESCAFDEFKDRKGNTITREQALSSGNKLTKALGINRGSRILRAEAGMTAKYSAAKTLAAQGKEVTIKGNSSLGIPDQKVSGSAIVGRMESMRTSTTDYLKPGNPSSVASVPAGNNGAPSSGPITFYKDGSVSPESTAQTFGHEILHTIYSGTGVPDGGWTNSKFNLEHQAHFNEASDEIQ